MRTQGRLYRKSDKPKDTNQLIITQAQRKYLELSPEDKKKKENTVKRVRDKELNGGGIRVQTISEVRLTKNFPKLTKYIPRHRFKNLYIPPSR